MKERAAIFPSFLFFFSADCHLSAGQSRLPHALRRVDEVRDAALDFGKRLIKHQVTHHKLADMAMRIEGVHAQIENVTSKMKMGIPIELLGDTMALLKVFATRTVELCSREASQIFGGASYVRGGVGAYIERAARDVRGMTVPGGSDEILAAFAIRQTLMLTARAKAAPAVSTLQWPPGHWCE